MVESNDDDAAKGYEVVPSFLRVRTGSRGSRMKRASSAEHLQEENDPDHRIPEVQGAEASSQSVASSPFAQRRADRESNDPPDLNLHGFHLGTLPRKKKVPTPKTRHVYAMVSKNHGAQENDNSKRTPPSPLPKPKRVSNERRLGDNKEVTANEDDSQDTATSTDIPKLEVAEPVVSASPPAIDSNTADKPSIEDDTVSLQGMPSSEISHEQAEGGQIYAVINKKTKKSQSKEGAKVSDPSPPAVENVEDVGNEDKVNVPKKKPPPKPPRVRPPKPAPYTARSGSPIPSILARERGSPLPPEPVSPAPNTPSPDPPPIPDRTPLEHEGPATSSVSPATQPPLPPSPGKHILRVHSMYTHPQFVHIYEYSCAYLGFHCTHIHFY